VVAELPADSAEADEECKKSDGKTLLYVFGRGCAPHAYLPQSEYHHIIIIFEKLECF
jgi:hypothetical protein